MKGMLREAVINFKQMITKNERDAEDRKVLIREATDAFYQMTCKNVLHTTVLRLRGGGRRSEMTEEQRALAREKDRIRHANKASEQLQRKKELGTINKRKNRAAGKDERAAEPGNPAAWKSERPEDKTRKENALKRQVEQRKKEAAAERKRKAVAERMTAAIERKAAATAKRVRKAVERERKKQAELERKAAAIERKAAAAAKRERKVTATAERKRKIVEREREPGSLMSDTHRGRYGYIPGENSYSRNRRVRREKYYMNR